MFVVQRVELLAGHQCEQLRKLESSDAGWLEQHRKTGEEIIDLRHVGQYVVGRHQIRCPAFAVQLRGRFATKEQLTDLQAFGTGGLGGAARRLDAQAGNTALGHVLQQVAIVGGNFHHATVSTQFEALGHLGNIALGVGQPSAGKRAEIGVLGVEQCVRAGVILGLHQPALLAHRDFERHPLLGLIQLVGPHIGVGRR
ncbi:hypothetical protein D3C84_821790 [compost metagenome]